MAANSSWRHDWGAGTHRLWEQPALVPASQGMAEALSQEHGNLYWLFREVKLYSKLKLLTTKKVLILTRAGSFVSTGFSLLTICLSLYCSSVLPHLSLSVLSEELITWNLDAKIILSGRCFTVHFQSAGWEEVWDWGTVVCCIGCFPKKLELNFLGHFLDKWRMGGVEFNWTICSDWAQIRRN